jgi:outer membrane protein TolC
LCLNGLYLYAAGSDTGKTLDLNEAVRLALANNLNLKKNQIDLASSGYQEKYLWSEIFPSINANMSTGYSSPLFSGDGIEFNENALRQGVGLGLTLNFNAGIPYTIKNINLAHQGNILKYEDACNQLSIQVTKKFYSLITEKNNLAYLEELYNLALKQYERNEVSFRNGLIGQLSLMQSRLTFENYRYNLLAANTVYQNNTAEFLAILGMSVDTQIDLSGDVSIVKIDADAQSLINDYLHKRPDIIRAVQEIERLEASEKQSVLSGRAPSLTLSLEWSSSRINPFNDSLSGTARLSIPIDSWLSGTSKDQAIRRARESVEKAKLDLAMTEDSAKTQIRSLTALLRNSWNSIEAARLSQEVAVRSYELTEYGFINGTIEYLTLENARNNMAESKQRLLQSELSYFNMTLDLCTAVNIDWKKLTETFGVPGEEK